MNSVSRAKILTIPPFEKFKRSAKLIMTELKEIHTCVQSSKYYILYFYKNLNNYLNIMSPFSEKYFKFIIKGM